MLKPIGQGNNFNVAGINRPAISNNESDIDKLAKNKVHSDIDKARKVDSNAFKLANLNGWTYISEGYLEEFDKVTKSYDHQMSSRQSESELTSPTETIRAMEKKYQEFKTNIMENFTGEEQEKQMAALDKEYNLVMKENIVIPMEQAVEQAITIQKTFILLSEKLYRVTNGVKEKLGGPFSKEELDSWGKEVQAMRERFKEFKNAMNQVHSKEGALEYALGMSDIIVANYNNNTAKRLKTLYGRLDEPTKAKIQEFTALSKEKEKLLVDDNKYRTDEEKYQNAAQRAKELDRIDKKLSALFK